MKHLKKLLFAVMIVMSLSSYAQDSNNPWALSFGVNAVDTRTSAGGGKNWADRHFSQAFNVKENWNILPSVSYLKISRSVGNNFSVGLQGSINKISKFVNFDPTAPGHNGAGYVVTNPGDLMYYGVDVDVKYSLMSLINSKVIDPSLTLGGGYTWLGDNSYGTVNPGAGLTFWFNEVVGLELATKYKLPAFGVISYTTDQMKISPVVYVVETDTLVIETSCGSGSIAISILTGTTDIIQPTGEIIKVERNGDIFSIEATVQKL